MALFPISALSIVSAATSQDASAVAQFAYIVNRLGNTISVIDINKDPYKIAYRLLVAGSPIKVAATKDGSMLYVICSNSSVSVIDRKNENIVTKVPLTSNSQKSYLSNDVSVTPDGKKVYVVFSDENHIRVLNTQTNQTTKVAIAEEELFSFGVVANPRLSEVYVSGDGLFVINTNTNEINRIHFGYIYYVAVTPDGTMVYATNPFVNDFYVIETNTNPYKVTKGSSFLGRVAVSPYGERVYATSNKGVSVIDRNENPYKVKYEIPVEVKSFADNGIAVTLDGSKVYLTNPTPDGDFLFVIDTNTKKVKKLSIPNKSVGVTIGPG